MSEKAKVAVPVVIGTLAIVMALGSVEPDNIVELGKGATAYSNDHARVQSSDAPPTEQPPTF